MSVAKIKPFLSLLVFLYIFLFSVCSVIHLCQLNLSHQFAPIPSLAWWLSEFGSGNDYCVWLGVSLGTHAIDIQPRQFYKVLSDPQPVL